MDTGVFGEAKTRPAEVVETAVGGGSDTNGGRGIFQKAVVLKEVDGIHGKSDESKDFGGSAVWDEISLDGTFLDGDARCHCSDGRRVQRAASNRIYFHGESHFLLFGLILIRRL